MSLARTRPRLGGLQHVPPAPMHRHLGGQLHVLPAQTRPRLGGPLRRGQVPQIPRLPGERPGKPPVQTPRLLGGLHALSQTRPRAVLGRTARTAAPDLVLGKSCRTEHRLGWSQVICGHWSLGWIALNECVNRSKTRLHQRCPLQSRLLVDVAGRAVAAEMALKRAAEAARFAAMSADVSGRDATTVGGRWMFKLLAAVHSLLSFLASVRTPGRIANAGLFSAQPPFYPPTPHFARRSIATSVAPGCPRTSTSPPETRKRWSLRRKGTWSGAAASSRGARRRSEPGLWSRSVGGPLPGVWGANRVAQAGNDCIQLCHDILCMYT